MSELARQQTALQAELEPGAVAGARAELQAGRERVSSLRAGLRTWADHLQRILSLAEQCDQAEQRISAGLEPAELLLLQAVPTSQQETEAHTDQCQVGLIHLQL